MEPDITVRCHHAKVVRYADKTIAFGVEMPDGSLQSMRMTQSDFIDLHRAVDMIGAMIEAEGQRT